MNPPMERLTMAPGLAAQLRLLAAAAFPLECCGVLFGCRVGCVARVTAVLPSHNSSVTPARHFEIDGCQLAACYRQSRRLGLEWLGFFHSHPNGNTTLSRRDIVGSWRGYAQLVVAPTQDEIAGWVVEGDFPRRLAIEVAA